MFTYRLYLILNIGDRVMERQTSVILENDDVSECCGMPVGLDDSFGSAKVPYVRDARKVSRNDFCPCGSFVKFKRCCIGK